MGVKSSVNKQALQIIKGKVFTEVTEATQQMEDYGQMPSYETYEKR